MEMESMRNSFDFIVSLCELSFIALYSPLNSLHLKKKIEKKNKNSS